MTIPRAIATIFLLLLCCAAGCGEDLFSLDGREEGFDDTELEACSGAYGATWYVHPDGGDWTQCTGLADAPYPGSGTLQHCAFSHPFHVLPPGGEARMEAGDRLIISAGNYEMGYGDGWAGLSEACDPDYPWECATAPIPSGAEEEAPTCILGEGWDNGCGEYAVRLSAVHGASHVLSLVGTHNARIQCLEITDGSECISDHPELPCPGWPDPPDPQSGVDGIFGAEAEHVTLEHLWIHGMPRNGIRGEGWIANWDLADIQTTNNGWSGISFPFSEEYDTTWEEMSLTRVTSSWNGCGEWLDEPASPAACWDVAGEEMAGGYGVEAWYSRANWFVEDCDFSHNTASGALITLFGEDAEIWIDRVSAEGNAGPQIDVGGDTTIWNSLLISNCEFHTLTDIPYGAVTPCKLEGPALAFGADDSADLSLVNSTLYGQLHPLVDIYVLEDEDCFDSEVTALNNIFLGTDDGAPLLDLEPCLDAYEIGVAYNLLHGISDSLEYCEIDPSNLCVEPQLEEPSPDPGAVDLAPGFKPLPESPAVDHGLWEEDDGLIPDHDFDDTPRPLGEGVDCGAFEIL
jgi:hypothetical protein